MNAYLVMIRSNINTDDRETLWLYFCIVFGTCNDLSNISRLCLTSGTLKLGKQ